MCSKIEKSIPLKGNATVMEKVVDSLEKKVNDLNLISSEGCEKIQRPNSNCPEKIILVVDCAKDENSTNFEMDGKQFTPLKMVSRAIQIFLHNKTSINSRNQFALVFLKENSFEWVQDFTNDPVDIISVLKESEECKPEDLYDFTQLFSLISSDVVCPLDDGDIDLSIPPKYIMRMILFYGRSYSIPNLEKTKSIQTLLEHPYFTLDLVMTHEPSDESNSVNKIYNILQEIDPKGLSYNFSVTRNAKLLHAVAAKLLAHPLQRPSQHMACYDFKKFNL